MTYQQKYLRRAKLVAFILQLVPFVRGVYLNGSVARGEASQKSDIDFFIITKKNRIWTCRALVTLVVQLLGARRYGEKIAGRICLNRYQTEDNLVIHPQNYYHAWNYTYSIPLVDANLFERHKEQNRWMFKYHFRFKSHYQKSNMAIMASLPIKFLQFLFEVLFEVLANDYLEKILGKYQAKRILNDPRTKNSPEGKIFVSNSELRFHPPKS